MTEARREPPRVVVLQAEGPRGWEAARAAVGVVPFARKGHLHLAVVAKLALQVDPAAPGSLRLAPGPTSLSLDRPSRFPDDPPHVLDQASDLIPAKDAAEVFVVGHAHAGEPTRKRAVRVQVWGEDAERPILDATRVLHGALGATSFPMSSLAVGPLATPLSPRRVEAPEPEVGLFPSERHWPLGDARAVEPSAAADHRVPLGALREDARVSLDGVTPAGTIDIVLPGLFPKLELDTVQGAVDVTMRLDTLWIDLDAGRVETVFRAEAPLPRQTLAMVHRLVVSIERKGAERSREQRHADVHRGAIGWATTREDGGADPPIDPDDPRIEVAQLESLGSVAPEPRIPLPRFARISAELAEDRKERHAVLARHGVGERTWELEERAWLERMAVEALREDPTTTAVYAQLFSQHQDTLGTEAEARISVEDYANVRFAVEASPDPAEVLEQVEWSLARYGRVERRWLAAAEKDPAIAERLQRRLDELAASLVGDPG